MFLYEYLICLEPLISKYPQQILEPHSNSRTQILITNMLSKDTLNICMDLLAQHSSSWGDIEYLNCWVSNIYIQAHISRKKIIWAKKYVAWWIEYANMVFLFHLVNWVQHCLVHFQMYTWFRFICFASCLHNYLKHQDDHATPHAHKLRATPAVPPIQGPYFYEYGLSQLFRALD
jgi:hypothetical protein